MLSAETENQAHQIEIPAFAGKSFLVEIPAFAGKSSLDEIPAFAGKHTFAEMPDFTGVRNSVEMTTGCLVPSARQIWVRHNRPLEPHFP